MPFVERARAGDRRRARRARVRHRCAQGDARPRPHGLRDRPRARPARADGDRPGRAHERGGGRARRARRRRRPARRVLAWCEERGLVERREPYRHTIAVCERCESRIEPLISLQWWCRMDELGAPAIEALQTRRVRYHPESQHRFAIDSLVQRARLEHLAPGVVGAPAAGLVLPGRPRHRRRVGAGGVRRVRARRSSSATPTSSTRGSRRRCGRSRRSAGRTTRPSCAASTRATSTSPRARSSASGRTG